MIVSWLDGNCILIRFPMVTRGLDLLVPQALIAVEALLVAELGEEEVKIIVN